MKLERHPNRAFPLPVFTMHALYALRQGRLQNQIKQGSARTAWKVPIAKGFGDRKRRVIRRGSAIDELRPLSHTRMYCLV